MAATVVIVDVLSFTTTVTVAVERGAAVYAHPSDDAYATRIANRLGAHLAGPRGGGLSLSPASMQALAPGERVMLPSTNGARLVSAAARTGATVVAASLRNASAVSAWLSEREGRSLVVAAGEEWRDGTFRMAVEDLLGAGAVLSGLDAGGLSSEARVAAAAFEALRPTLGPIVSGCTSARALGARNFPEDASWAADLDRSPVVPVLVDGAFQAV